MPTTLLLAARYRMTATLEGASTTLSRTRPTGKIGSVTKRRFVTNTRAVSLAARSGMPRISDGQLLFLLHMLGHRKEPKEGGSRIAIIMNGSPLFTGDAGSGESEIRRWILENDWLEALIALPEQLFYNTGIATYVWVLTNRKVPERTGKVQLIDASHFNQDTKQGLFCSLMRKSLGDKRREIPFERAQEIVKILADFKDGDTRVVKDGKDEEILVSKIFPTTHFGYRKITVERPLRLNFRASPERLARLEEERGFQALAQSKKKGAAKAKEEAERKKAAGSNPESPPHASRNPLQGSKRVRGRAGARHGEGRH